ncbi:MAG: 4-(cytidine 5'-diphospho)-2-C-methyl-D-erythritol kinase [Candidatus Omnitrophica bacterium]|nr:4-(cytidine 5'-diphospho)-2-C-methyl-D-erythritol kinase [Candidatus Omnitrophota bacterium]
MVLNSFAKLNLYLKVIGRRADGYHNIETVFERIDLKDRIIIYPLRNKKINLLCDCPLVPKDSSNLAYRSAKLLQDTFKINQGAEIRIIKHIPIGAGLGGGSSNAAGVLLGLNRLWKINLSKDRIAGLAAKLGCDIPFFVYEVPFAEGSGRGDRITPLKRLSKIKLWHILVVPKIEVSTSFIYSKFDKYSTLTNSKKDVKLLYLALKNFNISLLSEALFNSLEEITFRFFPQVKRIKQELLNLGLKSILMSGSGPAVFGVVSSRKEADGLKEYLKKNRAWQVFVVRTT